MAHLLRPKRLPGSIVDAFAQSSPSSYASFQIRSFSHHAKRLAITNLEALDASKGDRERVVILGSGWAGYTLAQNLSSRYQALVVSPRSYFVFTPLLNSTSVGTLEFRTALEPIRSRRTPNVEFMQGWADDVDFAKQTITVETAMAHRTHFNIQHSEQDLHDNHTGQQMTRDHSSHAGEKVEVPYDKLIISVGCYSKTFGIPGVKEHAYFLKDISDARRIRRRILECFELASLPTTPDYLRDHLLRFAIVGGGPTGMEFAAELSDLVRMDLSKLYPKSLTDRVQIMVHDVAPKVLSMFGQELGQYAMGVYGRQGVKVKTEHHVEDLRPGLPKNAPDGAGGPDKDATDNMGCYTLTTRQDGEMGVGMCVWSTGLMLNPFMRKALDKTHALPPSSIIPNENPLLTGASVSESLPSSQSQPAAAALLSQMTSPTAAFKMEKSPKNHAVMVDDNLRVQLVATPPRPPNSTSTSSPPDPLTPQPQLTATLPSVYALGDTAHIRDMPLPATAQTASQQALYLAKTLNRLPPRLPPSLFPSTSAKATDTTLLTTTSALVPRAPRTPSTSNSSPSSSSSSGSGTSAVCTQEEAAHLAARDASLPASALDIKMPPFKFHNMGVMTYLGSARSVVQFGGNPMSGLVNKVAPSAAAASSAKKGGNAGGPESAGNLKGRTAWLFWRGAYLSMTLSWRNRVLMMVYWVVNYFGGRDVSRF